VRVPGHVGTQCLLIVSACACHAVELSDPAAAVAAQRRRWRASTRKTRKGPPPARTATPTRTCWTAGQTLGQTPARAPRARRSTWRTCPAWAAAPAPRASLTGRAPTVPARRPGTQARTWRPTWTTWTTTSSRSRRAGGGASEAPVSLPVHLNMWHACEGALCVLQHPVHTSRRSAPGHRGRRRCLYE